MSDADDAFLHVHLDHVQLKSQSQDYAITSGSAIWFCKIRTVQKPELTVKMPRKCSSQDCWLKDSAYQEWVLKVDKCLMCGVQNSAHFCVYLTVVMVLTKSNIGPYKSLQGPYLALVQVPGNHVYPKSTCDVEVCLLVVVPCTSVCYSLTSETLIIDPQHHFSTTLGCSLLIQVGMAHDCVIKNTNLKSVIFVLLFCISLPRMGDTEWWPMDQLSKVLTLSDFLRISK